MSQSLRHPGGRRRGLAMFALLLALQGPLAGHDVSGMLVLSLAAVPVLVVVARVLGAGWCASGDPLRAVGASTAVLFAAQELYSGIGVEWVNRAGGSAGAPDLGRLLLQHALALALAAVVAMVAVGARVTGRCARAIVRMVTPSPVVETPARLLISLVDVLRVPTEIAHHCGMRSPPRCALPC
ncbi:hypothetical protein E8D34_04295 [Nocardioides sp. GY 10113]|uniref:hypothetical protein n=1 Tax=Nocardioides sp. GY 10113 TaxID=2569761 RepID=UPI0010A8E0E6|nr:hypothetical protein [Nocardioides sp. GY 10113]TIC88878.1 hypothetical protein E8D34_04295 [Nocardioides sp. GY 10113]